MPHFINDKCNGCNLCYPVCPESAIQKCTNNDKYEVIENACTDCGECDHICPQNAIKIKMRPI